MVGGFCYKDLRDKVLSIDEPIIEFIGEEYDEIYSMFTANKPIVLNIRIDSYGIVVDYLLISNSVSSVVKADEMFNLELSAGFNITDVTFTTSAFLVCNTRDKFAAFAVATGDEISV